MKNKLAFIIGAVTVGYFIYGIVASYLGMTGEITFGFMNAFLIFIPLIILSIMLAWSINRRRDSLLVIRDRLLSFYFVASVLFFWGLSPIEDIFLLNISSGPDIAANTFFYLWQEVVFGGAAIGLFAFLFKPVSNFLRKYESDIKSIEEREIEEVSDLVSRFPIHTAVLSALVSFIAYVIGTTSFYITHFGTPITVAINNLLVGIAMGQMLFMVVYFFVRYILEDVNSILYIFGDVTSPKKVMSIRIKIFITGFSIGIFFVSIMTALFINMISGALDINMFYIGVAVNLILGTGIMILSGGALASNIIFSLRQVTHGMELIRAKNMSYRVNIKTGDEMEELAHEFNKLANCLDKKKCK